MANGYTREEIIERVKKHFDDRDFKCEVYWKELGEVRLPLYCVKRRGDTIEEEIGIDVITERTISRATYFPKIPFQKGVIINACSVKFFQYYLPRAKIFWAYGDYVRKNKDYYQFKETCEANGIGMLEVSDEEVRTIKEAVPLHDILTKQVEEKVKEEEERLRSTEEATQVEEGLDETADGLRSKKELAVDLSDLIGRLEDEYLHYLVYYGDPRFRRRAITSRQDMPDLSLTLINKLQEIKNLQYREVLVDLAMEYRDECRDDPEIALQTIQSLWDSQLHVTYPDIHRFESVLLLDPDYRDHFLHQFQVFLLGALIIDKLYNTEPVRSFEESCGCKLELAWLAASTYHDFNYAIQEFETWMTSFFKQTLHVRYTKKDPTPFLLDLEKVMVRNEFLHKVEGLFQAIGCEEVDDHILRFILGRLAWDKNHATLGALTFLNKFKGKGRLTTLAANHAAASILLHDDPNWQCFCGKTATAKCQKWERAFSRKELLPQLQFHNMPLAFLLTFCDKVQEWGRIGRGYEAEKAQLEQIELEDDKFLVHISLTDDSSCNKRWINLREPGQYLEDARFGIRVRAHEGSFDDTIWMAGKPKL